MHYLRIKLQLIDTATSFVKTNIFYFKNSCYRSKWKRISEYWKAHEKNLLIKHANASSVTCASKKHILNIYCQYTRQYGIKLLHQCVLIKNRPGDMVMPDPIGWLFSQILDYFRPYKNQVEPGCKGHPMEFMVIF